MHVRTMALAVAVAATGLALGGCSESSPDQGAAASGGQSTVQSSSAGEASGAAGACPVDALTVTVSVDQWGSIVSDLAGSCGVVTSLISSAAVDPHDYEPTTAEATAMAKSDLIVVNGADYDHWASDLAASAAKDVPVVDAAALNKVAEGANPHLWYSPTYVFATADAVTAELSKLAPDAATYFTAQHDAWVASMDPYTKAVAALRAGASGQPYGASESVFDYMAEAIGLVNKTPDGYAAAAAHESEPSPGDLKAFQDVIAQRGISVLIYNSQTEGALQQQLRDTAESADVPVVSVTESMPEGADSFLSWQLAQLTDVGEALGVTF